MYMVEKVRHIVHITAFSSLLVVFLNVLLGTIN